MSMYIGDYAKLGQVFTGCSIAAGATTGLSTTYTGLLVYNPFGSGVNLLMFDACAALSTAVAGTEVMISVSSAISQTAVTAGTNGATIQAAKVGTTGTNGGAQAITRTATTLPVVNVNFKVVPGSNLSGSAVTESTYYSKFDGSLIVVPGTGVMFSFTTAAYTGQYSFTWAEVPSF